MMEIKYPLIVKLMLTFKMKKNGISQKTWRQPSLFEPPPAHWEEIPQTAICYGVPRRNKNVKKISASEWGRFYVHFLNDINNVNIQ